MMKLYVKLVNKKRRQVKMVGKNFLLELGATKPMPPARVVSEVVGLHEPPFHAKLLLALQGEEWDVVVYGFQKGTPAEEGYEFDWSGLTP